MPNMMPTDTHACVIRNLQAYINKEHKHKELRLTQSKFAYIDKWTHIDQINHKLSNQFWENPRNHKHSNHKSIKILICPIHVVIKTQTNVGHWIAECSYANITLYISTTIMSCGTDNIPHNIIPIQSKWEKNSLEYYQSHKTLLWI